MDPNTMTELYNLRFACNNNIPHPATLTLEERSDVTPAVLGVPEPHKFVHLHFKYSGNKNSKEILIHRYKEYLSHDWFDQRDIDKLNLFRIAAISMHIGVDISHTTGNLGSRKYLKEDERRLWFPNLSEFANETEREGDPQENAETDFYSEKNARLFNSRRDIEGAQGGTSSQSTSHRTDTEELDVQNDNSISRMREMFNSQSINDSFERSSNTASSVYHSFASASNASASNPPESNASLWFSPRLNVLGPRSYTSIPSTVAGLEEAASSASSSFASRVDTFSAHGSISSASASNASSPGLNQNPFASGCNASSLSNFFGDPSSTI
ncbi:hypothetical protein DSL72_000911 [Monilinia vaccinii-corymbosi]|uniref:Uncharacterized protein n=1 Tax=Monilinia vaccinii-corymbosi TaxID=61207 RepID=A0A8A3P8W2_9HELO|nr:hypothetical protein DSL72_000911 [Monilinia vaccinii-corymbosi]